ncbi:hypothetical protein [Haloplanus rubicundus]|uniref:Uncharacterized protein n=1 Tax=Haloplanus rubicundus TaxID=1547898 RepID=A0A345EEC0_9EURY|nr:hypothetical protein [Haloplanus rubicundus]AXG10542.1 hypothetical protein DU484_12190 [Haloplanus rubicundus]
MTVNPSARSEGETVDWKLDVDDSSLLLGLAYVFPSILGGVIVLAFGLLLWLVSEAVWAGDLGRAIGLIVVAVLALLSRRYLPALLETGLETPFFERFSRRGLLVGSLLGALTLLGSAQVHPSAPFAVFVASWIPLVLTAAFPTSGHADLAAKTLVVDETEVPLQEVRTFRTISVGTFAVCWLSYTRGSPTAPRIVVLPSDYVDAVATLIDAVPESSNDERPTIDRAERIVAGLFGLGMVAIGPLLWLVLPPGDGKTIALYAGAMFGLFGVLLLWYAYTA